MEEKKDEIIRVSGWVEKKMLANRNWKRRFLLVGGGYIRYYNQEVVNVEFGEEFGFKGEFPLRGARFLDCSDSFSHSRSYCMELVHGEEHFIFQLSGEEEFVTWSEGVDDEIRESTMTHVSSEGMEGDEIIEEWYQDMEVRAREGVEVCEEEIPFIKYYTVLGGIKRSHERLFSMTSDGSVILWRDPVSGVASERQQVEVSELTVEVGRKLEDLRGVEEEGMEEENFLSISGPSKSLALLYRDTEVVVRWAKAIRDVSFFNNLKMNHQKGKRRKSSKLLEREASIKKALQEEIRAMK